MYDYLLKIIIIGDTNTGKSSLLQRTTFNKFSHSYVTTIGLEFGSKIIKYNDISFKLHIWDTAGQERFQSLTDSYYHFSIGYLLVFDLSDVNSFYNLEKWIDNVRNKCSEHAVGLLIGNKSDLGSNVPTYLIQTFAKKHNLKYIQTSAKTGENVSYIFRKIVKNIYKKCVIKNIDHEGIKSKEQYENTFSISNENEDVTLYNCYGNCIIV